MQYVANPGHRETIDRMGTMYPSSITSYHGGHEPKMTVGHFKSTSYLINVGEIPVVVTMEGGMICRVPKRGYMAYPGVAAVEAGEHARFFVIERAGYRGMVHAGMIENRGRYSYIDGCSDSMMVPPCRLGDPVLNYLHFPAEILQTQHQHPSIRLGIILAGTGVAWQRRSEFSKGWEQPLLTGGMFCLEEQEIHSFKTPTKDMDIVAYHPDSDWGPTDHNHPMLNRTYINHGAR